MASRSMIASSFNFNQAVHLITRLPAISAWWRTHLEGKDFKKVCSWQHRFLSSFPLVISPITTRQALKLSLSRKTDYPPLPHLAALRLQRRRKRKSFRHKRKKITDENKCKSESTHKGINSKISGNNLQAHHPPLCYKPLGRGCGASQHNCLVSYMLCCWRRHVSATVGHIQVTKMYVVENYTEYDHSTGAYCKLLAGSRCGLGYTYWDIYTPLLSRV